MQPLVIRAATAVSAIGRGTDEMLAALHARRTGLRPCDLSGLAHPGHIGRVQGVEAAEMPAGLARFDCRNNRLAAMALAMDGFAAAVATARRRFGAERIAVVLGTSTSGVHAAEQAYRARDATTGALPPEFDDEHTHDLSSLSRFVRAALGLRGPALTVSTACASSARSFIDATHLIASGVCDAAVVGGADSLCGMTLHGFAALGIVSLSGCRPCDLHRDGISVAEAAGVALIEPGEPVGAEIALLGAGAASDGHHMSSPHPEAAGAVQAMQAALQSAGIDAKGIDYINLHGTGTKANDAMEDLAVFRVFGDAVPCSSTKGWTGHTMGSSGIVEAVIAMLCLRHGLIPGCLGVTEPDPEFRARVMLTNAHACLRRVMSNSFGFGGINCSLIFGRGS